MDTSTLRVINVGGVGAAKSEGIELFAVGVLNGIFPPLGDDEISGVPVVIAGTYYYMTLRATAPARKPTTDISDWS